MEIPEVFLPEDKGGTPLFSPCIKWLCWFASLVWFGLVWRWRHSCRTASCSVTSDRIELYCLLLHRCWLSVSQADLKHWLVPHWPGPWCGFSLNVLGTLKSRCFQGTETVFSAKVWVSVEWRSVFVAFYLWLRFNCHGNPLSSSLPLFIFLYWERGDTIRLVQK